MDTVTIRSDFRAKKKKSVTASTFSPSICHEMMELDATILVFLFFVFFKYWVLNRLFHSPLAPSSRGSLVPLCFLSLKWYHVHFWGCWYFSPQSWFQLITHPASISHDVTGVTINSLVVLPSQFWISHLFHTKGPNCCFLTCIQVSQEIGKMVWYSHLSKSFPQFVRIHTRALA